MSQSAACLALVWSRGIFSGHPPAAGWTAAGVVLNNLGPMGELFSSATAQPFLFAFTLFQTKKQWGDKHLKASKGTTPKSLALL